MSLIPNLVIVIPTLYRLRRHHIGVFFCRLRWIETQPTIRVFREKDAHSLRITDCHTP